MIASTRFAIVTAVLAAAAVGVSAANATGWRDGRPTIGDVTLLGRRRAAGEGGVPGARQDDRGLVVDPRQLQHFVIAGPLTFVFHEVVYFGRWMPWLLMDQFEFFKRWKIQPDKRASGAMVWKCLKRLLFSHVFIQLPMQLLFHWVAQFLGFSMALPLPPVRDLAWQLPRSS